MVATLRHGDFIARLRALLLSPRRAWGFIAIELPDPVGLFLRLVIPLAAIAPVAKLVGWSLFFDYLSPGTAVLAALLAWVLNLAGVALLAGIAARLAPYFNGEGDIDQALKLVAYAAVPGWLGGIFRLVPVLGILSMLASLYGLYLLYCGAPQLLGVPQERTLTFTLALGAVALLLYILFGVVIALLLGLATLGMA